MLKNRTELEEEILAYFVSVYRNKRTEKIQDELIRNLSNRFSIIKLVNILNNRLPLPQLSEQELFFICNFIYKTDKNIKFDIKDWFTESEISQWINSIENNRKNTSVVEIENVMYNGNELAQEYLCYITYKELAKMLEIGLIEYDTTLQRSPKIISKMGKIIEIPTINLETVEDIKEKMLNGEFYSNQITLNMLQEGNIFWNYHNRKLSIDTTKGRLLVIDGGHRLTSVARAYRENENIEGVLCLNIKALDADGCKNFIWQESLANRHNEENLDRFNINSKTTLFINKINSYKNRKNNALYRFIKTHIVRDGIISEDIFREGLIQSKLIEILNKDKTNMLEFTDYICNFFNAVKESVSKHYPKDVDLIMENPVFIIGMMILAEEMYNAGVDERRIDDMIMNYDIIKNSNIFLQDYPLSKKQFLEIKHATLSH